MGDQIGGDGAAGARTVLDDDGPLQPLAQPLRQEPRQQVGGRADAEAAEMWTGFDGQGAWAAAVRGIAEAHRKGDESAAAHPPYRPSRLDRRLVRKFDQKPGSRGCLRLASDITR